MTNRMKQCSNLLRRAPLIGHAFDCDFGEHWETAVEIFVGLLWSMLPILVGTFDAFVKGPAFTWSDFQSAVGSTTAGGELFIYAAAFLAPIFWIIHHVPPGAGPFPSPIAHGILTILITLFAALAFQMQRTGQQLNPSILHGLALLFFWMSVLLIYLATLYHNHRLPAVSREEIKNQEQQFLENYRERHE
jgi:hypothetical protein